MAHAKCSIFGAFNINDVPNTDCASQLVYYGLHALQHRGQESAGIVAHDTVKSAGQLKHKVTQKKGFGLVLDVFEDPSIFKTLKGHNAVGHTRYSTAGGTKSEHNIQPLVCQYKHGNLAVAHNGNISNFHKLKEEFVERGTLFQSASDTELILHSIAQSKKKNIKDQILDALSKLEGAFSLVIMTDDAMYAVRDPNGLRPLVLGRFGDAKAKNGAGYMLSSETCAFDLVGAECMREIEPGEVLVIDKKGAEAGGKFKSYKLENKFGITPCIFEFIYFARPDSRVFGAMVDTVRHQCGVQLARELPVPKRGPNDPEIVVVGIPDSSNTAALGFQQECLRLGYPCQFEFGIIRNHYVGRTFITPSQRARELKVRCKFNVVRRVFEGKIVVLLDDSIVRGTTSKNIIRMVRKAGAKAVHFRVASPPVVSPCFYGMDFPSRSELLANHHPNPESIAKWLGADSLGYLSVEGMTAAVNRCNPTADKFCRACFTEEYPVPVDHYFKKIEAKEAAKKGGTVSPNPANKKTVKDMNW